MQVEHNAQRSNPLLARVSRVVNQAIAGDEKTAFRLRELGDCAIRFQLRRADTSILIHVSDGKIALSNNREAQANVVLTGDISNFIAMAKSQRDGGVLAAGQLDIQGDLASAQRIQTLIASTSFDIERLISRVVGPVLARQIGRGARGAFAWVRNSHAAFEADLEEYLHFEARVLPTQPELEQFIHASSELATDIERLSARVARLSLTKAQL